MKKQKEIKFKVYDSKVSSREMTLEEIVEEIVEEIENGFLSFHKRHFMRNTDIKDINGKEIYENDVIMDRTFYDDLWLQNGKNTLHEVLFPLKVTWIEKEARFQLLGDWNDEEMYYQYSDQLHDRKLEVIGNMYEGDTYLLMKESIK